MEDIQTMIAEWDGECVVCRFDKPTRSWIFIALHSSALGVPTGGTRLRSYPTPGEALRDAMRLGEGMTAKWAVLGLPIGGAKAVLAVPDGLVGETRRGLLLRYGRLVESLSGAFATGEDLGTTPEDMAVIASATRWVHGTTQDGGVTDPGPFTARGVFTGIEAAVRSVLERNDLEGVRVVVQGIGDVGGPLCRLLAANGARLLLADPDQRRVAAMGTELGEQATVVAVDNAYDVECEVFAPCAIGGVINRETIPRLRCRIVAGSANNQLMEETDAELLHQRGIVYAPDYVINGGGALAFARYSAGEHDLEVLMAAMDGVGETVGRLLAEAKARQESPLRAAARLVAERLQAAE